MRLFRKTPAEKIAAAIERCRNRLVEAEACLVSAQSEVRLCKAWLTKLESMQREEKQRANPEV